MEPKRLRTIIVLIVTIFSGLFTIIYNWKSVNDFLFPKGNIYNLTFFVTSILVSVLITFIVMNSILYKKKEELVEVKKELNNYMLFFKKAEITKYTDLVTGIPNEKKFKSDIDKIKPELYQIILIDIDGFSYINNRYGFHKGDIFIREIAQHIYMSMRRDEEIYKRKVEKPPLLKRIYRKYTGGDEFIFLIKGEQHEAVGFITRIQKQLRAFSKKTIEYLPEEFSITFHGAISPFYPYDDFQTAYDRVQEAYTIINNPGNKYKVYWNEDEEEINKFEEYIVSIYNQAKDTFRVES